MLLTTAFPLPLLQTTPPTVYPADLYRVVAIRDSVSLQARPHPMPRRRSDTNISLAYRLGQYLFNHQQQTMTSLLPTLAMRTTPPCPRVEVFALGSSPVYNVSDNETKPGYVPSCHCVTARGPSANLPCGWRPFNLDSCLPSFVGDTYYWYLFLFFSRFPLCAMQESNQSRSIRCHPADKRTFAEPPFPSCVLRFPPVHDLLCMEARARIQRSHDIESIDAGESKAWQISYRYQR